MIRAFRLIIVLLIGFTIYAFAFSGAKRDKRTKVLITTSYGQMKAVLYDETPLHRDNFIKLVKEDFYDSLTFHRIINNFMIQGGDPNSRGGTQGRRVGNGGPGYTIPAEFNADLIHKKGALAAARQGDGVNPERESSGSQFYIVQGKKYPMKDLLEMEVKMNEERDSLDRVHYTEEQMKVYEEVGGTPFLDMNYTVFGEVTEGFNVIDSIASISANRAGRTIEEVFMSIEIIK